MLFTRREVRIGKNCARGLGYGLGRYTRQGTVFPNTDRPWLVNNIFIFFLNLTNGSEKNLNDKGL